MRVLTPHPQYSVGDTLSLIIEPSAETAHPDLVLTPHIGPRAETARPSLVLTLHIEPSAKTAHPDLGQTPHIVYVLKPHILA